MESFLYQNELRRKGRAWRPENDVHNLCMYTVGTMRYYKRLALQKYSTKTAQIPKFYRKI